MVETHTCIYTRISIHLKFHIPNCLHFCPGQTRAFPPPAPIFPGLRWVFVTPCDAGIPLKPWRFMTPWKPLSILQRYHKINILNSYYSTLLTSQTPSHTFCREHQRNLLRESVTHWAVYLVTAGHWGWLENVLDAVSAWLPNLWTNRNILWWTAMDLHFQHRLAGSRISVNFWFLVAAMDYTRTVQCIWSHGYRQLEALWWKFSFHLCATLERRQFFVLSNHIFVELCSIHSVSQLALFRLDYWGRRLAFHKFVHLLLVPAFQNDHSLPPK